MNTAPILRIFFHVYENVGLIELNIFFFLGKTSLQGFFKIKANHFDLIMLAK